MRIKTMTISQIEAQYKDEWVLIEDPQTNENLEVQGGKVLWHGKDREELYRRALEMQPKYSAIIYTGGWPEGMEFILCAYFRWAHALGSRAATMI